MEPRRPRRGSAERFALPSGQCASLNRHDTVIEQIVDLLIADINKRLTERRVTVALDEKAKIWVAEKGYDPVFGARPLKRFLQRHLETRLARAIIAGEIEEGATVTFKATADELVLA